MNIGFKNGTSFYTDSTSYVSNTFENLGEAVEITLTSGNTFICGIDQEFFTKDNELVKAIDSLNVELYNGELVVDIQELGVMDLFDITVSNDEHSYYIIAGTSHVKVHNGWIKKTWKKAKKAVTGGVLGSVLGIGGVTGAIAGLLISKSNNHTNSTVSQDTNIYMPETEIAFTCSMLKPNTRLYAFFDGKDVSQYVAQSGKNYGDTLVSNSEGYISGKFKIPNNSSMKFIAGKREFKLTDSVSNEEATTSAVTYYTYSGSNESSTDINSSAGSVESYIDPIVQSFSVNSRGGAFVSRVGLFFYAKDESVPLLVQIREVVNDAVSSYYLEGASVTVTSDKVNINTNPLANVDSSITWVNFDNPIYLSEGKEYCIFIIANTNKYVLHSINYGQIVNDQIAGKDVSVRSLMKNQGASTWSRDNANGLKFILQKCKFNTNNTYQLNLVNEATTNRYLTDNCLSTHSGTNKITVYDPNHSFNDKSFVKISGVVGTHDKYTESMLNCVHQITDVTWDTYSFDNYYDETEDKKAYLPTADTDVVFGSNIITDTDYQYDNFFLNTNAKLLTGTNIVYNYTGVSGKSLDGNDAPYIQDASVTTIVPKTMITNDYVKTIVSKTNASKNNVNKSFRLVANLSTTNENVSPVLDTYNNNLILVENLINNQFEKEITTTGDACARYVSKTMDLSGTATGLKVQFLASVQPGSSVKVYYKTLAVGENLNIDVKPWNLMNLENDVLLSNDENDFETYSYIVDGISEYRNVKLKIVMNSNNSVKVPLIKNLAAVAFKDL